jgi:hypothetical protein
MGRQGIVARYWDSEKLSGTRPLCGRRRAPNDGFIGQDILRESSAVRIDYKASVVEFEK